MLWPLVESQTTKEPQRAEITQFFFGQALRLRRPFQPLQRFENSRAAALGFLALLALALDHLLRRAAEKIGVAELGVDAGHVAGDLGHLLLEPAALGGKIDHALERQCR